MGILSRLCAVVLVGAAVVVGCGAPGPPPLSAPGRGAGLGDRPAGPKRIVAATKNVPSFLYYKPHPSPTAGAEEVGDLLNAGLVITDDHGLLRTQIAESVPSLENGLWHLFPDGRMETTVKLKPTRWHDGEPFTSDDLVFTYAISRDPELAVLRHVGFDSVDGVEAVDAQTVLVKWKRPYIEADALFSSRFALPLPKHLLEGPYAANKGSMMEITYWNEDFVGTGPFKLREYARSDHLTLQANDAYVLGRPKLDEIEVRFITDDNTFVANLLAGAVDFTLGRGPSLEQALTVRDQWRDGRVEFKSLDSWLVVYPQFLDPRPAAVANPRFREALLLAIDREEMVGTIQAGLVPVADGNISPNYPRYKDIEPNIIRHPYDPRRAAHLLEGLGYTRAAGGGFRDTSNQPLTVELRATTVLDILPKTAFAVADSWQRFGLGVETDVRSVLAARDPEWAATFPGFTLQRQTGSARFLPNLRSSQARVPERNFNGLNITRYTNADMDALIDRYVTTVPIDQRTNVVAEITHQITDEVIWLTLFFDTEPTLIANRVINAGARGEDSNHAWNVYEWDVTS